MPLNSSFAAISRQIEISSSALKPAWFIASKINSMASSLFDKDWAKPPSSPTLVEKFLLLIRDFNFWITKLKQKLKYVSI